VTETPYPWVLLPEGRASFDLPVGPLRLRVVDLPTAYEPFIAERYAPFVEPAAPGVSADLTVTCRPGVGIVIPLPGPGHTPVIEVERLGDGRYRVRSHWQDGTIDVASGTGEITITDRRDVPLLMSIENFLRVASQLLLPDRRAFLLHAAGVLDAGKCHLFFGHSGAGKTTATMMSRPRPALSDDLVIIGVGEGQPMAWAVPFAGAFPLPHRTRGCFPVAAAFRLRQDPADRLVRLSPARAAATLSASVPFIHDLGLPRETLTEMITDMAGRIPVFDLFFTRSPRFWDLIAEELATK
jgi:hypothetical protein